MITHTDNDVDLLRLVMRRIKLMNEARRKWNKVRQSIPYMGVEQERQHWNGFLVRNGLAEPEGGRN